MSKRSGGFTLRSLATYVRMALVSEQGETRRVGREHFIPVRPSDLIETLASSERLSQWESEQFRRVCTQVQIALHHESRQKQLQLQDAYVGLNPDSDTESLPGSPDVTSDDNGQVFVSGLLELLERANFRRLTVEEIEAAIGSASTLGVRLHLDLDRFQNLALFVRGETTVSYRKWSWRDRWLRWVEFEVPLHQRLVVLFQRKADDDSAEETAVTYLRLFKNVPRQDIVMLLPGGEIRMSLLDRGKILLPMVSGVGLVLFKMAMLFVAGIFGLIKIAGLIGGAVGSGWKSVNGYWKTKNRYELNLTKNLYYQNLDSNLGVVLRLANEAELQELREAVLGYFVLLTRGVSSTQELDVAAEAILRNQSLEVDFEVDDALQKMVRLGICEPTARKMWRARSPSDATGHLMARNLQNALRC